MQYTFDLRGKLSVSSLLSCVAEAKTKRCIVDAFWTMLAVNALSVALHQRLVL